MKIEKDIFGPLKDGTLINLFTIKNDKGLEFKVSDYGAAIVSIKVPDRDGNNENVVLGFDYLESYIKNHGGSYQKQIDMINALLLHNHIIYHFSTEKFLNIKNITK
jgi:hypothetical protein